MNILIIGYGAVGRFYFNLLKKNKKIKNIFIFDTNKKIIDKKFYLDFNKKNLINENIKFAIIATPSHLHFKFAQLAIKNNLNLLIEKPLVLNIKNAKKLIKLSSELSK
jgi:UDP-N-acetyl-2-amino-2-deoxyglucuronate dehydrogenase